MNHKLSNWASVAEILSGIAVVFTLIFLTLEVRDNTAVMRSTAFDRNMQALIDIRLIQAQRPDIYAIAMGSLGVDSFDDYASMSEVEKGQAWSWNSAIYIAYEKAYYAEKYGLLGESESARFVGQACRNFPRFDPELRERILRDLTTEYRNFLEAAPECISARP